MAPFQLFHMIVGHSIKSSEVGRLGYSHTRCFFCVCKKTLQVFGAQTCSLGFVFPPPNPFSLIYESECDSNNYSP